MSLSLAFQSIANASATCTAQLRGQMIAAAGYYFGYWFSRRRV